MHALGVRHAEDDRRGITADVAERVFERGFSTSTDGTGFGRCTVRQVAAAHGWTVAVVGGVDGGARFAVTDVEFT